MLIWCVSACLYDLCLHGVYLHANKLYAVIMCIYMLLWDVAACLYMLLHAYMVCYHMLIWYVSTSLYVIFKNRVGVLYRDLKHEAIAECFRRDQARTASFLNVF